MPVLGLGAFRLSSGRPALAALSYALSIGYRHIDTAAMYGNERDVGAAVKSAGIPQDELFVTTKLWNDDHGYETALRALEKSRKALGLEEIDLYLIHWPVPGRRKETWRALTEALRQGKCRAIGVSNFTVPHLEELLAETDVPPAVNQVEFSPFLYQRELLEYCRQHGIQLEAYSPLTKGARLEDPTVVQIAEAHRRTPAQVLIRWGLQHDVVEIPKSARTDRIRENTGALEFQLSAEDMARLDQLSEDFRTSWDPTTIPEIARRDLRPWGGGLSESSRGSWRARASREGSDTLGDLCRD
jgi:diketogulonate reductase-like aldo/keto reductase